jgi:hypothetical protein
MQSALFLCLLYFWAKQKESEGENPASARPTQHALDEVSKQRQSLRSHGYPIGVGYDELLKNRHPCEEDATLAAVEEFLLWSKLCAEVRGLTHRRWRSIRHPFPPLVLTLWLALVLAAMHIPGH